MRLARAAADAIVAHARHAAPAECCGLLLGTTSEITEAVPARNLSADPNRFLLDPRDHIAARRAARTRGLDIVGFYHSHPHSAAAPSPTDIAEASYGDAVHLIVSLAAAEPSFGLFRIGQGSARPVDWELV